MKTNNKILKTILLLLFTTFLCSCPGDNIFDFDNGDNTENNDSISGGGDDFLPDTFPNDSVSIPDKGDDFFPDIVPNDSTPKDVTDLPSAPKDSIPQKGDTEFEIHQGHVCVDLGLPSGIKWAAYNIGATAPEMSGGYYAWGETEEKKYYHPTSYKYYKFYAQDYEIIKYCVDSIYGIIDNKRKLDLSDDVAHVKWGGTWRIPGYKEINELRDYCIWKWDSINDTNGMYVTGPNGNSIFIPAGGYREGTLLRTYNEIGKYWLNFLSTEYSYNEGACFTIDQGGKNCYRSGFGRDQGFHIRAVCD